MFFRSRTFVRQLFLNTGTEIVLNFGGLNSVVVTFSPDIRDGKNSGAGEYRLEFQADPSPKVREMFVALAANKMPSGSRDGSNGIEISLGHRRHFPNIDNDGNIKPGTSAPLELLPPAFEAFLDTFPEVAGHYVTQALSVLRWRCALEGPPSPLYNTSAEWSFDGTQWHPEPSSISFEFASRSALTLRESTKQEIQELVNMGVSEPVSHVLFREAWENRGANPRSALVIGIAAAETAVKLCIGTLVPDAAWLVENMPSPPLVPLLTEYLPQLPARYQINGKVLPPPDRVLKALKKGVFLRNKIAHTGAEVEDAVCDEVLASVWDVLWLCDFYSGHEWAIRMVAPRTKEELGLHNDDDFRWGPTED